MIRTNLLPQNKRTLGALGFEVGGDHLRDAILGVAAIAAVSSIGVGVETLRVHRIDAVLALAATAVANRSAERAMSTTLALQVSRYQEIAREAEADRQSGTSAALAVAQIGNAVPGGVWLDSLTHDSAGFVLSGTAESLDAVSTTISRLEETTSGRRATLVSIDNRDGWIHFTAKLWGTDGEVAR
jgi:hypothetical protein